MRIFNHILIMILILAINTVSYGQTDPKKSFFADYEKMIDDLAKNDAEVLSPELYKKAVELYKEANEYYDKQESVIKIREKLNESSRLAQRADQIIKMAQVTLKTAIDARNDAMDANAPLYAEKEWERAEKRFLEATRELESDDVQDAREYGKEAEELFRDSELIAIKNGILGDARTNIQLAEEAEANKYSYHTFRNAQKLLIETETLLNSDRYARDEAKERAGQASYEGRHAQYLAKTIKELSKDDQNWELLILKFEDILRTLGTQFSYDPPFDEGFEAGQKTIAAYIKNMKEEKDRLLKENSALEEEVNLLREKEANASAELNAKKLREKKINKISELFTPAEAEVIYEGKRLIIRLIGLTFQSGDALIQPEYFSLLTKLQRAIYEFPENYIIIEGHTDGMGNALKNKLLSEDRARAVKEYLMANMDLDAARVSHYGLGDQKPIASNKTAEGRAQNRRIEIIISLEN
ncbi:MAG: OmpA family protein [Calditrichaceae bacterium]|nr:OmpA family protein [Calditrichaceae bacterium]MBN2709936.1 OmpA family protein [Calditrichaceae bacterium]RQV92686.1 MAG: OmpA family protein [Calditrichota bacterium]